MLSNTLHRGILPCLFVLALAPYLASADPLPVGVPTAGTLAPSGTVEYTLTIPTPGQIAVTLDSWEGTYNWGTDYDRMYLYNSAGDPVGWHSFGSEEDPYFSYMISSGEPQLINVGEAGTYTLRLHSGAIYLWPEGMTVQAYTIAVAFSSVPDAHEDNGTIASATDLAFGNQLTAYQWRPTPTFNVHDDEDIYRITPSTPGILTISLAGWVSTYNWSANYDRLYLYTSDGVMFDDSGDEDMFAWMMGDDAEITAYLAAGGTYYIRLHAGNGTSLEPYTLQCDFQSVHDIHEPNDQLETATPIEAGTELTAYQWRSLEQGSLVYNDEDWYTFTVAEDGTVTISMTGWVSTYNWGANYDSMFLYRLNGAVTEEVARTDMLGAEFSDTYDLETGTYAIRLHGGNGISSEPYTIQVDCPTGNVSVEETAPEVFSLEQPYPNPFNPETAISFTMPESGHATITIYDVAGRRIRSLTDSNYSAGYHHAIWNGTSDAGETVSTGVYFVRLNTGGFSAIRKVVMIK